MAARCQITISLELSSGNWQPDANSFFEYFIHFQVNRTPFPVKRQPDASSHFLVNRQMETGSQMPMEV